MLKANIGNLWLFGLDEGNIERLKKDQPIFINGDAIGIPGVRIAIFYKPTNLELIDEIKRYGKIDPKHTTITDASGEGLMNEILKPKKP